MGTTLHSRAVGWLGCTALQHLIGYIAPASVVNVKMSAHAGFVGSQIAKFSNVMFGVYGQISNFLSDPTGILFLVT